MNLNFNRTKVSLTSEESVAFYENICAENYGYFLTIRGIQSKRLTSCDYADLGFFHEMNICRSARIFVSFAHKSHFIRFGELLL